MNILMDGIKLGSSEEAEISGTLSRSNEMKVKQRALEVSKMLEAVEHVMQDRG